MSEPYDDARTGDAGEPHQTRGSSSAAAESTREADALMPAAPRFSLWALVGCSVAMHAVLVGATSVGYLLEVAEYGTWDPAAAKAERHRDAERDEARAQAEAERQTAAEQAARQADPSDDADDDQAAPIEETITETSDERPTETEWGSEDPEDW
ncbi:MAG: hypothetical protein ACOC8F_00720 [Planctomycetota bacterium]